MIEILFLIGFTLHNIEEAIWLPKWSRNAQKYHKEVSWKQFLFAVSIITVIGYLLTLQYILLSSQFIISKYLFLGFVSTMVLNSIFPHLILTIVLNKYAPGTASGLLFNAPIGIYILLMNTNSKQDLQYTVVTTVIIATLFIVLIKILLQVGKKLFG